MTWLHPAESIWLGSLAVAGVVIVAALVAFVVGPAATRRGRRRRAGSMLLPALCIDFFEWAVDPVVRFLDRLHVHPNHITLSTIVAAAFTGLAFGAGHLVAGWWLLVLTGCGDTLDGRLARRRGEDSPSGAFLDSFADRLSDAFFLGGLAYFGGGTLLSSLSIWALVASLAVSYARARGEGLGIDCAVGLMQRPERVTLLAVTLFVALLMPYWTRPELAANAVTNVLAIGVGALAVLSSITAINRARWIVARLRAEEETQSQSTAQDPQREPNQ